MSSFGEEIRRERELREITLREISEATKISMRHLDALERNDFRHLPGGVFNKGFVRAYAQYIGIDPDAMVNAYLLEEQTQEARQNQRDSARKAVAPEPSPNFSVRIPARTAWAILTVIVLLLIVGLVLGFFLLRNRPRGDEDRVSPAGQVSTTRGSRGQGPS